MKGKFIATAVAASLALAGQAFAETPQDRLQDLLDSFQQDYGFLGATAAMALPDGSMVTAATGVADDETGTPMTSDSGMLAASMGDWDANLPKKSADLRWHPEQRAYRVFRLCCHRYRSERAFGFWRGSAAEH